MEYPNPKTASIEEYKKFLQKEYYLIPKWWETVQKEGVQFTSEQTKLVEDFWAAGKDKEKEDVGLTDGSFFIQDDIQSFRDLLSRNDKIKTATKKERKDFKKECMDFVSRNEKSLPQWWQIVRKEQIEYSPSKMKLMDRVFGLNKNMKGRDANL